ncbi:MAG: hypothetical protein H7336_13310 [Bacteriovorax sp.]|nr:hypothetical protein [Bacteriovorax sp.]
MTEITKKNWYINGKKSDLAFIILCPLFALIIVALICEPRGTNYVYSTLTPIWFAVAASVLTHAHVLLVFTRSHMNMSVFKRYKYRFTVIPVILLLAMWVSNPLFLLMGFVGVYWDEWHSLMQTFGFGRIYDGKAGNDPLAGRKLDMGMAFVVGLLPNLVLLTYLPKTQIDGAFAEYLVMPLMIVKQYGWLVTSARIPMITFGIAYSIYYIISYRKLIRNGYQYSKAKLALFAVTGITTITIASIYTIADGVFFGNIYHALQYIFIVLVTERSNLSTIVVKKELQTVPKKDHRVGFLIFFLIIIPLVFILAGFRQVTEGVKYAAAFWLMTSLMHFWFDGFIWSVRRQDIGPS